MKCCDSPVIVLCVLFFKSMLLSISRWFINIELMADSTTTHAWKIIWYLCSLPDTSQSYLGAPDKPSVWGPFRRANPSKKGHKNARTVALNVPLMATYLQHESWSKKTKHDFVQPLRICVEELKFYTVNFILCTCDIYYKEVLSLITNCNVKEWLPYIL